ncbi:MAG: UDP-N-acetylmuramate dehydrogenase [Buchnera aphidicola (Nurudea yanoniella)]
MIHANQSLKKFHTFKINTYAKKIIIIKNIHTLIKTWNMCQKKHSFIFLGEGSNTLFSKYYNGIVAINKISGITISENDKNWLINAKGGVKWHDLVVHTLKLGIYGLENLAFIPGTVGAAPIQNIGAYGVEFKDVCEYVEIFSLINFNKIKIQAKHCMFKYRNSIFKKIYCYNYIILSVGIKLKKIWIPNTNHLLFQKSRNKRITALKIFNYIKKIRREKLPNLKKIGNAGSFFKNPIIKKKYIEKLFYKYKNIPYYPEKNNFVKLSAGWLIEKCKLKGYSVGGAQVYKKQALILINRHNSTARDILTLAEIIQKKVKEKFNIFLEKEINIIGKNNVL